MNYSKKRLSFLSVWIVGVFLLFNCCPIGLAKTYAKSSEVNKTVEGDFHNFVELSSEMPQPNAPRIEVRGNNEAISSGDSEPDVEDGTHYGEVDVDAEPIERTFVITNVGTGTLQLQDLTSSSMGFGSNAEFKIVQPNTKQLDAGESVSFSVIFKPGTRVEYITARIDIPNNVSSSGSHWFYVSATVTGIVDIQVKGNNELIANDQRITSELDHTYFGVVDVSRGSVTRTFWIVNTGNVDLSVLAPILSTNTTFVVEQLGASTLTIPRDESISFQVTFNPEESGPSQAIIYIQNTSLDKDPYSFLVEADGKDNGHILVKGNEINIDNGDLIPSPQDHTSFGNLYIEADPISRTYWISNTGTADLTITGPIESDNNQIFSVIQPEELIIARGEKISFTVVFNPNVVGMAEAIISIPNDDPDDYMNPYIYKVEGRGSRFLDIVVKGNGLLIEHLDNTPHPADHTDFGSTPIDRGEKTSTFWIVNRGDDTLNITGPLLSNESAFTISQPSRNMLLVGDSVSFTITFLPGAVGRFTSDILIPNDHAARDPYQFVVAGGGVLYVNGVPIAIDDHFGMQSGAQLNGNVLLDDGIDTLSHDGGNKVTLITNVEQGQLSLYEDGSFSFMPADRFWGTVHFVYALCDVDNDCDQATVTIKVEGSGIVTYNAFSPDGDGLNDIWEIDNIENYTQNQVTIFNRWGNKAWEGKGYDNQTIFWNGQSNSGLKLGSELPEGTYFYVIEAEGLDAIQGYVVLSRKR